MMNSYKRFGQIFWGLLLVFLGFEINNFDLLPDAVGYILLAIGCGGLSKASVCFSVARTLSWTLAVLWSVGLVIPEGWGVVYTPLQKVVDCAMIWFLFDGIMDYTDSKQRKDLSQKASDRRIAYIVIISMLLLAAMFGSPGNGVFTFFALLLAVFYLVVWVLVLDLVYRIRHEVAVDEIKMGSH